MCHRRRTRGNGKVHCRAPLSPIATLTILTVAARSRDQSRQRQHHARRDAPRGHPRFPFTAALWQARATQSARKTSRGHPRGGGSEGPIARAAQGTVDSTTPREASVPTRRRDYSTDIDGRTRVVAPIRRRRKVCAARPGAAYRGTSTPRRGAGGATVQFSPAQSSQSTKRRDREESPSAWRERRPLVFRRQIFEPGKLATRQKGQAVGPRIRGRTVNPPVPQARPPPQGYAHAVDRGQRGQPPRAPRAAGRRGPQPPP